jgi:hypothetical protein
LYRADCNDAPGCMWLQQACYPAALAPAIAFPPKLADVKRAAHAGDAAVWGACAGVEVYKRYSAACNFSTEAGCVTAKEGHCTWIPEYAVRLGRGSLARGGGNKGD